MVFPFQVFIEPFQFVQISLELLIVLCQTVVSGNLFLIFFLDCVFLSLEFVVFGGNFIDNRLGLFESGLGAVFSRLHFLELPLFLLQLPFQHLYPFLNLFPVFFVSLRHLSKVLISGPELVPFFVEFLLNALVLGLPLKLNLDPFL